MKNTKKLKKLAGLLAKLVLHTVSVLFITGTVIYGIVNLSAVLPSGFTSEVFYTPLRMMQQELLMPTVIITILSIVLIVRGATSSRLWYLMPVGIILVGIYWLTLNIMVIKIVKKVFEQ